MKIPLALLLAPLLWGQVSTDHVDLNRTGANVSETTFTLANVAVGLQRLGDFQFFGQMYTQPLYAPGLTVSGGTHNVLIGVTLQNQILAWDADTTNLLWRSNLGSVSTNCGGCDLTFLYGISPGTISTPVLDLVNNVFYVAYEDTSNTWKISKGNLLTGGITTTTTIAGSVSGTGDPMGDACVAAGVLSFCSTNELARAGLAYDASAGHVYVSFASISDMRPFHGWLFSYNTSLVFQAIFCTSPNGYGSGIWMSGSGPAIDGSGNVYVVTGNGTCPDGSNDYGQTVIKLNSSLVPQLEINPAGCAADILVDADLGSSRLILIPGQNKILVAGKDFNVYVLDATCTGFQNSASACILQNFTTEAGTPGGASGSYGSMLMNHVYYVANTNGHIFAYTESSGVLTTTPLWSATNTFGFPGMAGMAGSINGTSNGIVWVTTAVGNSEHASQSAELHALNATTGAELWNSGFNFGGALAKFVQPTIPGNGKVYMAGVGLIAAYGLPVPPVTVMPFYGFER